MNFNNIEFKAYDDMYYVSKDGDVYSKYKNALLKHYIDHDGYHRVDIHGKHIKIHRMVYEVWNGEIPDKKQVNHYDDNKDNNNYLNLYIGNQRENIRDCIENGHRAGNVVPILVLDNESGEVLSFPSIKSFLDSTGHHIQNGSISHVKDKNGLRKSTILLKEKV